MGKKLVKKKRAPRKKPNLFKKLMRRLGRMTSFSGHMSALSGLCRRSMERIIRSVFTPPDDPMRSRLARRYSNEVSIFLGENNTVYVNHICLTGPKDPGVLINMLWQAMQLAAMKSGLTLRMPQEAAAPAILEGHIEMPPPPPGMENMPMTRVSSIHDAPTNGVGH